MLTSPLDRSLFSIFYLFILERHLNDLLTVTSYLEARLTNFMPSCLYSQFTIHSPFLLVLTLLMFCLMFYLHPLYCELLFD